MKHIYPVGFEVGAVEAARHPHIVAAAQIMDGDRLPIPADQEAALDLDLDLAGVGQADLDVAAEEPVC